MKDDLISREALKEALKSNCKPEICHDYGTNWCESCCQHNDFEDLIDNAPSVTPRDNYDLGYVQGLEDGRNERPKGEWTHGIIKGVAECVECSECKLHFDIATSFCPNCGADMRGDNNGKS